MKISLSLTVLLCFFLTSCDFILKEDKNETNKEVTISNGSRTIVAQDEDEHGCAYTAGYKWSSIKKDCVRIFEKGFRLNPIGLDDESLEENELEDNDVSCFVLFSENKKEAEIFLPNKTSGLLLDQSKQKKLYTKDGWELETDNNLVLKYKGEVKFTAAKTVELKIINSDLLPEEDE